MRYADLLDICPKLETFTTRIPEELDSRFQLRSYAPHEIIRQKDSPLETIGILLEGSFRVVNEFENGNVFMIEMNDAPSFVGEVALLARASTTSVTIETVTDCRVAYLSAVDFDAWLRQDMELLRSLSEHVAAKLYCSSYSRGERLFYSAKYVLLKYITRQAESSGIRGAGRAVIGKTRQQISEEVGMTVKTINRILTKFGRDGLISMERGKVVLDACQYHRARQELKVYISENRNGAK
ncbi:MAG: Crp/Fnr family transcriptional regulator [Oscillospiraceae bacterium]|nr:Crp/Fnr family transcriptional regulator [Oscillospiraceae bacterium]